jgi:hypothetical protein
VVGVVDLRRSGAVGPAKSAGLGDLGAKPAAGRHGVVWAAAEAQLVRVGLAAVSPLRLVVDLLVTARFQAVGAGAATVSRVADQPLIGGGDAILAT